MAPVRGAKISWAVRWRHRLFRRRGLGTPAGLAERVAQDQSSGKQPQGDVHGRRGRNQERTLQSDPASGPPDGESQQVKKGRGTTPLHAPSGAASQTQSAQSLVERLYAASQHLKAYLADAGSQPTTEAASPALRINKQLDFLGYASFDDLKLDAPVDSGDFAHDILNDGARRIAVIEAKKVGTHSAARRLASRQVRVGSRPAMGRPHRRADNPALRSPHSERASRKVGWRSRLDLARLGW